MFDDSESVGASISKESESSDSRRKSDESKSSGETFSNTSRANTDPYSQLGAQETRIVRKSKVCVYIFLLLTAIIGSLATWYFLTAVEQQTFSQQVFATKLHDCAKTLFSRFGCSNLTSACFFFAVSLMCLPKAYLQFPQSMPEVRLRCLKHKHFA